MNERVIGRGRKDDIHSNEFHASDSTSGDIQVDLVERAAQSEMQEKKIDASNEADNELGDSPDNDASTQSAHGQSTPGQSNSIEDVMTDDAIAEYLEKNSDFFRRRSDLLSALQIPHVEAGDASSLVEKQVVRLRLELATMQARFEQVVESARMAEQQQARVHRTTMALVSATNLEQVKERVLASLKVDFNIDHVSIRLHSELDGDDNEAYVMLSERVAQGRSFCDHRLPTRSMHWMFGDQGVDIASCAVVPVGSGNASGSDGQEDSASNLLGIIGLGATDPERFSRDMGTVYLDRLGQLIGAVIARL